MSGLLLSLPEARVMGALVEKSVTTPAYYPMTVNALMLAANQKSARHPVMNLSEGDVGAALNRLETDKLVSRDDLSGRVTKWRHHVQHYLLLKSPELAVLATLILRGPQTASELRSNAAVLGGPADAEALNAVLDSLADRAQPLVALLPKSPGQSSPRFVQLLTPVPAATLPLEHRYDAPGPAIGGAPTAPVRAELEERLQGLEARVARLESLLAGQTGVSGDVADPGPG